MQWRGAEPVFIDIPSFEALAPGEPWYELLSYVAIIFFALLTPPVVASIKVLRSSSMGWAPSPSVASEGALQTLSGPGGKWATRPRTPRAMACLTRRKGPTCQALGPR